MNLTLPRVVVLDAGSTRARIGEAPQDDSLSPQELELLRSKSTSPAPARGWVERCEPLERHRWAVGRQFTPGTGNDEISVWRVISGEVADQIGGHPAWLWSADPWFYPGHPAQTPLALPEAQPLRHVLRRASPSAANGQTVSALAGVVAQLREGSPRKRWSATAMVVHRSALTANDPRARWLALALLAILPPSMSQRMRVYLGGDVESTNADLAFVPEAPRGFGIVYADHPPTDVVDVLDYYIRDRLNQGDPEAVEAAALLFDVGSDGWAEGVASLIRDGLVQGPSALPPAQQPGRASLSDRFENGEELTPALLDELVRHTHATQDPTPWKALWRHSAVQRANAVLALIRSNDDFVPDAELLSELCGVYPQGASLDEWLPALLRWLENSGDPQSVMSVLQITLAEWPGTPPKTRAKAWLKAIQSLSRRGMAREAQTALLRSPMTRLIAESGEGRSLAAGWVLLPSEARGAEELVTLVEAFSRSPRGDEAAADLFGRLRDRSSSARLIRHWVKYTADTASPGDALLSSVRGTPHIETWGQAIANLADRSTARRALEQWAPDRNDPLWQAAGFADRPRSARPPTRERNLRRPSMSESRPPSRESRPPTRERNLERPTRETRPPTRERRAPTSESRPVTRERPPTRESSREASNGSAREELLRLGRLDVATPATEARMLSIAATVLKSVRLPDPEISEVAAALAGQAETDRVWGWVALATAAPGTWDEDTIDATVNAFCYEPPTDTRAVNIALQAARSLGGARRWSPIDHARWMVRLSLAHKGPLNQKLAKSLLEGVGQRTDGPPFLADMFVALLELPPEHPAINWMLELLIPSGWRGQRLARVLRSVPRDRVPHQLRDAWSALASVAGD